MKGGGRMDKEKRKKQEDKQRKDKIRKLFQNSVGVTASAAAVVVATPLFDNVTAEFNDFKLLEDAIYYDVEVVEEVLEDSGPNALPLRLVIENQWERIEVALDYGTNENVLSELRPNANYTFTVQMDKGLTWVTLASEQVTTENELAGVIGPVEYRKQSNEYRSTLSVFTQSGGVDIQFYQLALIQDGQTITFVPVDEGTQALTFSLPLTNERFNVQLQAVTESSELIILDEKIIDPPAHFATTFAVELIGPSNVLIKPGLDATAFTDMVYQIDIIENGVLIDTLTTLGEPLTVELLPSQAYTFVYYVNYIDDRSQAVGQVVLDEAVLSTPDELFYILNIVENEQETVYLLTVESYDRWFRDTFIRRVSADGTVVSENTFERISTAGDTTLFRFRKEPTVRKEEFIIGLVLNQEENLELIIKGLGE